MAPQSTDARVEQVYAILINAKRPIVSVQVVAAEHGFTDLTEFNRLFRERYGTSAVALRKAVRQGRIKGKMKR